MWQEASTIIPISRADESLCSSHHAVVVPLPDVARGQKCSQDMVCAVCMYKPERDGARKDACSKHDNYLLCLARMCKYTCVHAGRMRERDVREHFIYGAFAFVCARCSNGQTVVEARERGRVKRGSRVQSTFDNRLRDPHQNEIMLVNLSSINYLRSRLQCIHYSSVSILLKETTSHIICIRIDAKFPLLVLDGIMSIFYAESLFHTEVGHP